MNAKFLLLFVGLTASYAAYGYKFIFINAIRFPIAVRIKLVDGPSYYQDIIMPNQKHDFNMQHPYEKSALDSAEVAYAEKNTETNEWFMRGWKDINLSKVNTSANFGYAITDKNMPVVVDEV